MYDKAAAIPSPGSLRETLFLTIWLRRQEIEFNKVKTLLVSISDTLVGTNEKSIEAIKLLASSMFPFMAKTQATGDAELKAMMEKEVRKGPLTFSPAVLDPIKKYVKKVSAPDDFHMKLKLARERFTRR